MFERLGFREGLAADLANERLVAYRFLLSKRCKLWEAGREYTGVHLDVAHDFLALGEHFALGQVVRRVLVLALASGALARATVAPAASVRLLAASDVEDADVVHEVGRREPADLVDGRVRVEGAAFPVAAVRAFRDGRRSDLFAKDGERGRGRGGRRRRRSRA